MDGIFREGVPGNGAVVRLSASLWISRLNLMGELKVNLFHLCFIHLLTSSDSLRKSCFEGNVWLKGIVWHFGNYDYVHKYCVMS